MTTITNSPDWWRRARAYLKPEVADHHGEALVAGPDDSPVLRDFGNGLLVSYVVDEGGYFLYVQHRHLALAQATENELHRVAVSNLAALTQEALRIQPYGPIYALFVDGNFEASVLLLDDLWDTILAKHVSNEVVVALPSRDVLAFGDSGSPEAIKELRGVVERVHKAGGDHLVSSTLYRRHAGQWVPHDA